MEAWEKVFIEDDFLLSVHNTQNCVGCHGGIGEEDEMEIAHAGIVRDPLETSDRVCGVCHVDATRHASTSLHQNLTGYYTALSARGADFSDPAMQEAFDNHCDSCHTTCGQCHISRPSFTFGGLISGHRVKSVASIRDTCLACHGARVANEYQGRNEGVERSVHWVPGGMSCFECHDVTEYHGDGTEPAHRYAGEPDVRCLDCHPEVATDEAEIVEHEVHINTVACEVCHVSGPYKNCYGCHVGLDDQGLPYYQTEESQMDFKIGRNPLRSEDRPWEYVLVRHVPVVPDTFAFYGEDLMPEFANQPTWKVATPHNIQRETPQNQTCECCHCNEELFLTADDVAADEIAANASVIVPEIPTLPDCPRAAHAAPPPSGPGWAVVLGIGVAIAGVTATPIVIRRKEYWE